MKEDELPPGWVWATLGDVVEVLDHKRVPVSAKVRATRPGKVPYYGATGQVGWIDESIFDEELVLLGEDGVQFFNRQGQKAYLVHGPSWVNNHAHVLRSIDGLISAKYLMHYLNVFNYEGYANGTTRLKLTKSAMLGIPIPLSPRVEQERIVDALEDHLSRLDKANSELALARSKVEMFRRRSIESALVNSETRPLASLLASGLVNGRSVRDRDGGFPVLRLTALKSGKLDLSERKAGDWDESEAAPFLVEEGDFLIARGNGSRSLVGRGAVAENIDELIAFPDTMIRIRIDKKLLDSRYFRIVWDSNSVRRYIESNARTTAGIYKINQAMLKQLPVPYLPPHEQIALSEQIDEMSTSIAHLDAELSQASSRAASLRAALLNRAFAGSLISQNHSDEPASILLERVKSEKAAQSKPRRGGVAKTATASTRPAPSISSDPAGTFVQEELGL